MKVNADVVFVGTVLSVDSDHREVKAVLKINKSWKGSDVKTLMIYTSRSGCGIHFEEGKSYIVYAKGNENKLLITDVCYGSALTEYRRKDIKRLGKPLVDRTKLRNISQEK